MGIRVGINGFGRIGRTILRFWAKQNFPFDIVMINELGDLATNAHLLRYDSVHGRFPQLVSTKEKTLIVADRSIQMTAESNPAQIPWRQAKVDIVLECTGRFTKKEKAALHLQGGAKKVIISAPAEDPDLTVAYGINLSQYNPTNHHIIFNASCTTNCLAPVAKVIHETFGIEHGLMTTIHSYTNDQVILDIAHKDLRRARAGAISQIPTQTGAAKAVGLVLPELKGKIDGMAIRVPTPNVSCVDFVCTVKKQTTGDEVNKALKDASETTLKGILGYSEEPLVSCDYNGDPRSAIVDALSTKVIDGTLVKILAWYDNESGFSNRMIDVTKYIGEKLS